MLRLDSFVKILTVRRFPWDLIRFVGALSHRPRIYHLKPWQEVFLPYRSFRRGREEGRENPLGTTVNFRPFFVSVSSLFFFIRDKHFRTFLPLRFSYKIYNPSYYPLASNHEEQCSQPAAIWSFILYSIFEKLLIWEFPLFTFSSI